METLNSSSESSNSILEGFKENPTAPFETVKKGEKTADYPYAFLNKLRTNWTSVCQLMDWKQNGKNLDWNFFEVASEPSQVVMDIQSKILEKGGNLPKYGVDGKFGNETLKALTEIVVKIQQPDTKRLESKPISPEVKEAKFKEGVRRLMEVLPAIEARLEKAGLKVDKNWLRDPNLSDADIAEYQTRAWKFREEMVTADPRLKPLNDLLQAAIPDIEKGVAGIDLSKINSARDFFGVMGKMAEGLEAKEKIYKGKIDEKLLEESMKEKESMENLMTLFISFTSEMSILVARPFLNDKVNAERITEILKNEFLIQRDPQITVLKESSTTSEPPKYRRDPSSHL